jgi:hypothetical protein
MNETFYWDEGNFSGDEQNFFVRLSHLIVQQAVPYYKQKPVTNELSLKQNLPKTSLWDWPFILNNNLYFLWLIVVFNNCVHYIHVSWLKRCIKYSAFIAWSEAFKVSKLLFWQKVRFYLYLEWGIIRLEFTPHFHSSLWNNLRPDF